MKKYILSLVFAILYINSFAQDCDCNIYGYVFDPEPKDLNVRSGAGVNFPVIDTPCSDYALNINYSKGNRLNVSPSEMSEGYCKLAAFKSARVYKGYVHAGFTFYAGINTIREARNMKAKILKQGSRADKYSFTIIDCKGDRAKVKTDSGLNNIVGWVHKEDICANAFTTCP